MKTILKLTAQSCCMIILAGWAVLPTPKTFALAADYSPSGPGAYPTTSPPQLADMTNFPNRVGGYFINANDFVAYKGDAVEFQKFLDACATVTDTEAKTLHLHPGKGSFQGLNKNASPAVCDWKLTILRWRQSDPAKLTATLEKSLPTMDVHLWLDGAVDFAKIKVPAAIKTVQEPPDQK